MVALSRASRPPWGAGLATRPVAVLLLLAGVAALSYANTFHASFHFDDAAIIVDNRQIKSFAAFRDLSETRYVGYLTFAANDAVGGLNPVGYHIVNLLIHVLNGFLVYILVGLLLRTPALEVGRGPEPQPPARGIALATALLFVVHPVQTQAVTYIVQRFTSLATLFYLLAVVSYLQWRLADFGSRARYGWYAAAVAATLLAMKTKESTVTLPLLLLVVEGVGFGLRPRRKWRLLLPFLALLPLIPLSMPAGMGLWDERGGWARETTDIGRLSYFATQCRVLVTYLRLLVWPVRQNVDYDYSIYHSLLELPVLASGLFLAVLLGLALYALWAQPRFRLVGFGVVWFFLTISVESSIIPIRDVIFEHRIYLPSVGLSLAGSMLGASLLARWRVIRVPALVALVVVFAGATYERNKVWADEITLWRDAVAKSPQKARPHRLLGIAYAEQGRWEEAVQAYQTALRLRPDYAEAHMNLGLAYAARGRPAEAIQEYQTALKLRPDFAEAHVNLGLAYAKQGWWAEAIQGYQAALQLRPGYAEARTNLGLAYAQQGQVDAAIQEHQAALRLQPDLAEAHNNLGRAYAQQGRGMEAIQAYQAALRLRPDYAEVRANLANAYLAQGQRDEAIQEYQAAISLKPDLPDAHVNLGNAYVQQGQWAEAIQAYQAALRLRPDYADAHYNVGRAYLLRGQPNHAITELATAIRLKPDFPEAHLNLGIAYARQGRGEAAIQAYETALQLQPAYAEAHYNLGIARSRQGRWDEAIEEFSASVRLKPDFPEAEAKLGSAYAQQERWDDAIARYQRALQLRAEWVEVRFQLGQVYVRTGRPQAARREFEAVVRLRPEFAPAQQALKQLDGRS